MSKTDDISRLDRSIKDAEIRINTLLSQVESYKKELDILLNKEKLLEENVKCLKKNRIIAIAQEFKKAKSELKITRDRITLLSNDKDHFLKSSEDMKTFIEKTKQELTRLQNLNDNNVLQFNRDK